MSQRTASLHDVADKSFDFLIIGGGTAGCALARRLCDSENCTIAVIEIGRDHGEDPLISNVDGWMDQIMNDQYDWNLSTTAQKNANNLKCDWSRGKGLGGSSNMNLMAWMRPTHKEMDAIGALGNEGWDWETFLKYSKKSESFCPPLGSHSHRDLKDHHNPNTLGHDGPIPISFARSSSGVEVLFQKAVEQNGVRVNTDYLNGDLVGTFKGLNTVDSKTGARTSAKRYIEPVFGKENLTVLTEARVNRIITSSEEGEIVARGVEFDYRGDIYHVSAKKEVILCAGAIKSPQILELSGIGDREILNSVGIPVHLDLPAVGTNLQDHVAAVAPIWKLAEDRDFITTAMMRDPSFAKQVEDRFAHLGLPSSFQTVVQSFTFLPIQACPEKASSIISSCRSHIDEHTNEYGPGLLEQYEKQLEYLSDETMPDIEYMLLPFHFGLLGALDQDKPHVGVGIGLTRAWSRGTLHVVSSDPAAHPAIDPRYLENDTEIDLIVEGFKFLRRVAETQPMESCIVKEEYPGPDMVTDEQIKEAMKKTLHSVWHAVGTLSMLPRDKGGVVDPKLKIYGTKNIRVVDISIIPLLVSAHTQALAYGIAEQAADIIKTAHGLV